MTASGDIRYSEMNASPTDWAHVFQMLLRPSSTKLESGHEQKRFSVAERRGRLRVVASPDARLGSLRVHQDILLYSAILARGQHVVHQLSPSRSAWLHVVEGDLALGEVQLSTGDGAGITAEHVVSLTANTAAELLLLDLGESAPGLETRSAARHRTGASAPAARAPKARASPLASLAPAYGTTLEKLDSFVNEHPAQGD
jgi:redox-sensitive bicupin YhaK (pirin superfamily)